MGEPMPEVAVEPGSVPTLNGDDEDSSPPAVGILSRAPSSSGMRDLAFGLIIVATSLYLLERLEPVLRPLLIAVLLCYLFIPLYNRLRRYMRPVLCFLMIAVGIAVGLQGIARMVYKNVVEIDHNLVRYQKRGNQLEDHVRRFAAPLSPLFQHSADSQASSSGPGDSLSRELSQRAVRLAANTFAVVFLESIVVAFYMIFLLQSSSRLPHRIRSSFSSEKADDILKITQSVNKAVTEYLVVKVKASLLVGVPIFLACWGFGLTGAVTWGVITFFGNFLPYIGALVAIIPPVVLAFLEFESIWPPIIFIIVVLTIHGVTSNLIEPAMTGKALGLNPLIVLLGLAFWSLLWGFVGMVLAVPLTVIFKIVLEHTPATRPLARMISEEEVSV
jgi:AI-2 transport protein TqsA